MPDGEALDHLVLGIGSDEIVEFDVDNLRDLTLGKLYEMLGVEGNGSFYRIVDDSGEDFLYPVSHFRVV